MRHFQKPGTFESQEPKTTSKLSSDSCYIQAGSGQGQASILLGNPELHKSLYQEIRKQAEDSGYLAGPGFKVMLGICRTARRMGWETGRKIFRSVHEQIGADLRLLTAGGSPLSQEVAESLQAIGWHIAG